MKGEESDNPSLSISYKVQGVCELVYKGVNRLTDVLIVARRYLNQRYEKGVHKKREGDWVSSNNCDSRRS
jgi:hypothetical protein